VTVKLNFKVRYFSTPTRNNSKMVYYMAQEVMCDLSNNDILNDHIDAEYPRNDTKLTQGY